MTDLQSPATSDPVLALRDELMALRDRVKREPERAEAIDDLHCAAEDKLSRTPAATLAGVTAKLQLYVGELLGRPGDGRIDRAAFDQLDVDRRILVGCLTDLERLVPGTAPRPAAPATAEPMPAAPEAAEPHVFWLERHTAHANEGADLVDAADLCAPQDEGLYLTAASLAHQLARRYAEMIYRTRATTPEGRAAGDAMRAFYGAEWDTIPEETVHGVRAGRAETAGIEEDVAPPRPPAPPVPVGSLAEPADDPSDEWKRATLRRFVEDADGGIIVGATPMTVALYDLLTGRGGAALDEEAHEALRAAVDRVRDCAEQHAAARPATAAA